MTNTELHSALLLIRGVCDGAKSRDNTGFSSADTSHGTWLVDLGADAWNEDDATIAAHLVYKYRSQLDGLGARPVELSPEAWAAVLLRIREARKAQRAQDKAEAFAARAAELAAAKAARVAAWNALSPEEQRAQTHGKVTLEYGELVVRAPYNAARVVASRSIPGRSWSGEAERYPESSLTDVQAYAQQYGMIVDLTPIGAAPPQVVKINEDTLAATPGYALKDALKAAMAPLTRCQWDGANRRWAISVTAETQERVLIALSRLGLRLSPELDL